MLLAQPSGPIIARIVDEPVRGFGLGDVILGAIGLTGAIVLGALLLGFLLAGIFIWYQKLMIRRSGPDDDGQTQLLGLTPPASK